LRCGAGFGDGRGAGCCHVAIIPRPVRLGNTLRGTI
jgi:hypothetical protein